MARRYHSDIANLGSPWRSRSDEWGRFVAGSQAACHGVVTTFRWTGQHDRDDPLDLMGSAGS